jgi:NAD(P)-dependent dehydrogenase (short-subunit alcohol dehydrogenase family)
MNTTPKVALVTGTASGLGQATAALLATQGFRVYGTTRATAASGSASLEWTLRCTQVVRTGKHGGIP